VAASPDGSVVYVTGITAKTAIGLRNEVTVAYNTATGRQLWLERYQGTRSHPRGSAGVPNITVSPDGTTVYVAGDLPRGAHNDYLVIAYNAAALSPDGSAVYVTGSATQASGLNEYATIGYGRGHRHQLWLGNYRTPKVNDNAAGLAVSPDGSTANHNTPADYATVAYGATSGAQLWSARYDVTGAQNNAAAIVAAGGRAIVTGTSGPFGGQTQFATVAYQG